jgi:hypothetical protein
MYYGERVNGEYFLRQIAPDASQYWARLTESEFYERWRRIAKMMGDGDVEEKIAKTLSDKGDFQVL